MMAAGGFLENVRPVTKTSKRATQRSIEPHDAAVKNKTKTNIKHTD